MQISVFFCIFASEKQVTTQNPHTIMANHMLKPLLSAAVAVVFTLTATAQTMNDYPAMQGRRGTFRPAMMSRRAASTQPQKQLRDGQLLIIQGSKTYTIHGLEIR